MYSVCCSGAFVRVSCSACLCNVCPPLSIRCPCLSLGLSLCMRLPFPSLSVSFPRFHHHPQDSSFSARSLSPSLSLSHIIVAGSTSHFFSSLPHILEVWTSRHTQESRTFLIIL